MVCYHLCLYFCALANNSCSVYVPFSHIVRVKLYFEWVLQCYFYSVVESEGGSCCIVLASTLYLTKWLPFIVDVHVLDFQLVLKTLNSCMG